jgi:carboxyl-terminal processing protease
LIRAAAEIAEKYVRPVDQKELLHTALRCLYEDARLPVPKDLRRDILQAEAAQVVGRTREGIITPVRPGVTEPGKQGPQRTLNEVIRQHRERIGDAEALKGRDAFLIACQAMARSLDPHSGVVTAEELRQKILVEEECDSVGLELNDGSLVVKSVVFGGPAQRAGVRPGDQITHLNGKPALGLSTAAALQALNQGTAATNTPNAPPPLDEEAVPPPKAIDVSLRRPGLKEAVLVTLQRQEFLAERVLGVARQDDHSWNYLVDPDRRIAHVRLPSLGRGTAFQLREAITGLKEKKLNGLILDLRWCPGGYLEESVEVARLFLGEGTVATVKGRDRADAVYRSTNEGPFRDLPMTVLVNGETTGGAELVAAALQDHGRAAVAGQRTAGKGSVQTMLYLGREGVGLRLTTATISRPSGKGLHRFPESKPADDWGVRPDQGLESRVSPDLGKALREWWLLQSLRPGPSFERLPLDDPAGDPQRQEALAALIERMERQGRVKRD